MVLEQKSKLENSYHLKKCIVTTRKGNFEGLIFKEDDKFYLFHNHSYYHGVKPINFSNLSEEYDYKFSYQINYNISDPFINQLLENEKILLKIEEDLEIWF